MKKLFVLISLVASIIFFSCQSDWTKQKICGTWTYDGFAGHAILDFHEDNTMSMLSSLGAGTGTYTIDGKDINIHFYDGGGGTLHLANDGNLYASDGSKYTKVPND